ncbi:MAG TPA: 2-oxoglutarate dehydrogenase complex dihydrolipoyllysine-residue succinyltransferase [Spirochaetia bacterium]|nr:2-oxoglutarate dehydrogenase complex dihydrolipoyllysine-residue succinyltransferase [Spirochaetia bacterium]
MSQEVKVPSVGESVSSGILAVWLKQDGDYVTQGEEIFELETDKATMAVPAPANGVLKIAVPKDTEVAIGQVVAHLEEGAAGKTAGDAATGVQAGGTRAAAAAVAEELSPAVRRLVADRGLDPASIAGTGKGGRITKEDVLAAADRAPSGAAKSTVTPGAGAAATAAKQPAQTAPKSPQDGGAAQRRVPMTTLRRRIAENLVHSKQSAAHLTTFNEVDMSAVMEIRKKYRDQFEKKHGVRLGFMSFFIKASQRALEAFPEANAFVDGTDILYNDYYNIGVASSTERGLITPVIRDADRKSFADIEREIVSFTTRAKEKKLSPDELLGGTFTISNGGVFGSMLSTPIPNPPQSTILGMHAIQDRPMAVDGQVVIRPMMYLALTYDHRILDGREAIGFLVKIKNLLEDPAQLMLDL